MRLDRARIAVACSGLLPLNGCHEQRGAGLAIVRDDGDEMLEEASFSSDELGGQPLAPTIDAVSVCLVVFAQYGDKGSGAPDRWRSLDVDLGLSSLLEIAAGEPFSLGDLLCEPTLGACFGADGGKERKTIRRFELKDGVLVEGAPTGFVDPYGLEPRTLGKLL